MNGAHHYGLEIAFMSNKCQFQLSIDFRNLIYKISKTYPQISSDCQQALGV